MERTEEWETIDFERYPKSENYWVKRVGANLVDIVLSLILTVLIVLILGLSGLLSNFFAWIVILIIAGIITVVIKALLESITEASLGQRIFGLRVVTGYDSITMGDALKRNSLSWIPIIFPVIDLILGMGGDDNRQKLMDRRSNCLVVEDIHEAEEIRPRRYYRPAMPEPEPMERTRLGFPDKLRVGKCTRCGAPYRILDDDDTSFSGLWNYRCTWCNHLIFEEYDRKKERWR